MPINSSINEWIAEKYGSRRGLINDFKYRSLKLVGKYQRYSSVDWENVGRLVFVCKGNICRSAFAEAVATSIGVKSISCGVSTHDDGPANKNAIQMAETMNIDLSAHKTLSIDSIDIQPDDLLLALEPQQATILEDTLGSHHRYSLLGLWGCPQRPYIHDPYGSNPAYFAKCFNYIDSSVRNIATKLERPQGEL